VRADARELDDGSAAPDDGVVADAQWPASMTLLEKMTLLPTLQSWLTWLLARKAHWLPTTVAMPPPSVPGSW
jgi:hypothetical protein